MNKINTTLKYGFKDVLILPTITSVSSRSKVNLVKKFHFTNSNQEWTGIPVVVSNMDTTGTFEMAKELAKNKLLTCIHKYYSIQQWKHFLSSNSNDFIDYIAVSSGITDTDIKKLDNIMALDSRIKWICLDVANGYMTYFHDIVKQIRFKYPNKIIIAGNVVDIHGYNALQEAGADIIKCGIGGGSVCSTRIKTGIGYPQLSMILDLYKNGATNIMSDGGCSSPGDICKAFSAGAQFVMLGGMFAGHEESGGELIEENGHLFKKFYGMSSTEAMEKHTGIVDHYRTAEGKAVKIPFKGLVSHTLQDILGGIRSCCTYVNASNIEQLLHNTKFILVQEQENKIFS